MGKRFIFSPKCVDRIWVSPASYSMGTFPGVKQVECEADDTPPYSAKVNEWSYTPTPLYLSMARRGSTLSFQWALQIKIKDVNIETAKCDYNLKCICINTAAIKSR